MFVVMERVITRSAESALATREGQQDLHGKPNQSQLAPIRRPYRGVQIKDDTYAALSIRLPGGAAIPLVSESAVVGHDPSRDKGDLHKAYVNEYSDFILQGISEQRAEKQQIVETFGDSYVFFFGERPRVLTFQGLLVNSEDFNWRSQFWYNYEKYIRGTKLVQLNARAYLSWDTRVVEGFVMDAQAQESADSPHGIPFGFTMLLTGDFDFSNIGSTFFPRSGPGSQMDLETANRQLTKDRKNYVSTTASVRNMNMFAKDRRSALASIRKGLNKANEVMADPLGTLAGNALGRMSTVLGGRSVRMPIGAAGFLYQSGATGPGGIVTVGVGSIYDEQAIYDAYDSKTEGAQGLWGSVKIRMPNLALFAPQSHAMFKSDNYDEYPLRKDQTLADLLLPKDHAALLGRLAKKKMEREATDLGLIAMNALAEADAIASDTLADIINVAKTGFGVLSNAMALVRDFENIIPSMFQLESIAGSFARTGGWPFNPEAMFNVRRTDNSVKAVTESEYWKYKEAGLKSYIGQDALATFKSSADSYPIDPETGRPYPVSLGEVYDSNTYQKRTDTADTDFESTYGDNDYTSVVERAEETAVSAESLYDSDYQTQEERREGQQVDPETHFADNGYISQEERAKETAESIDVVYGSKDPVPIGEEISEEEMEELYSTSGDSGQGYISVARLSPEERAAILQQMMEGEEGVSSEDVPGITGVIDGDADIEPWA